MGRVGNTAVRVEGGGWVNCGGVSLLRVFSTSKNRPSHHKYKFPERFELKQSRKALRALRVRWALPVYPALEDEKSNGSDEKSVRRKIAKKKNDKTNIITTNFV